MPTIFSRTKRQPEADRCSENERLAVPIESRVEKTVQSRHTGTFACQIRCHPERSEGSAVASKFLSGPVGGAMNLKFSCIDGAGHCQLHITIEAFALNTYCHSDRSGAEEPAVALLFVGSKILDFRIEDEDDSLRTNKSLSSNLCVKPDQQKSREPLTAFYRLA
jgi:hypothetical protein